MIKFFRKYKRDLLNQISFLQLTSPFGRYLLYAIGEIILVVLGILIAIQINNIHTKRINKQLEIKYLSAISDNLNDDIQDLQQRLIKDSLHLNSYTQLIKAFTTDSIKSNESRLKFIIHNSAIINYFNPQNTVFEEMKSSGKISLIQLDSLRYRILEYYNHSNKVVSSQEVNNQFFMKHKDRSIDANLDMNSLIESQLPSQWSTEISPFDNSFFDKDISDPEVEDFARSISLMKAGVYINHNWKKNLLNHAGKLKSEIKEYLLSNPNE
ncbi:MAG: hypothetical protein ACI8P3_003766 [Saprospiraceae bacterium]|jgi:hypothetical protein